MASPSGFVNFAEYLGLNKEAGEQMTERLMGEGNKLRDEANANADAHLNSARAAGEGSAGGEESYVAAGERSRVGLTSYGKFMGGLNDPAARQVLMEKLYGKGSVSWLDSALVGGAGAGQIAQGDGDLQSAKRYAEDRARKAGLRRQDFSERAATQRSQEAEYQKQRQLEADDLEKEELGRQFAMSQFDIEPVNDGVTPSTPRRSKRELEDQVNMQATFMKARRKDGQIDWDAYRAGTEKMTKQWDEGQANNVSNWGVVKDAHKFFMGMAGGTKAPAAPETWDAYYKRNRKPGAK